MGRVTVVPSSASGLMEAKLEACAVQFTQLLPGDPKPTSPQLLSSFDPGEPSNATSARCLFTGRKMQADQHHVAPGHLGTKRCLARRFPAVDHEGFLRSAFDELTQASFRKKHGHRSGSTGHNSDRQLDRRPLKPWWPAAQ